MSFAATNVEEIDAEQCIRLIKQENYDAVAAIERADAGCSDSISVYAQSLHI